MRAQLIYEKFIENSDPVKDMGIGFKDNLDYNDVDKMCKDARNIEIKKINRKVGNQIRKYLKEKLVGKVISGYFYDVNFNSIRANVRVAKIQVTFGNDNWYSSVFHVKRICVYGKKGKEYYLRNNQKYEITS
jgi:hypothetical protein